jgi:hypothetical protein
MGNPPYQPPVNRKNQRDSSGTGNKIWHKFVEKAFELCKPDGHVLMVTPNNWRRGGTEFKGQHREAQKVMWSNSILWVQDAKSHFPMIGTSVLPDAWHIQKSGKSTSTGYPTLDSEMLYPIDRDPTRLSILEKYFAAKTGDLIEAQKDRRDATIVRERDDAHPYPFVRTAAQLETSDFWWSSEKPKGFDRPKVFFSYSGRYGAKLVPSGLGMQLHFLVQDESSGHRLESFINGALVEFVLRSFVQPGNFEVPVNIIWRLPRALLTSDDPLREVFHLTPEEIALVEGQGDR